LPYDAAQPVAGSTFHLSTFSPPFASVSLACASCVAPAINRTSRFHRKPVNFDDSSLSHTACRLPSALDEPTSGKPLADANQRTRAFSLGNLLLHSLVRNVCFPRVRPLYCFCASKKRLASPHVGSSTKYHIIGSPRSDGVPSLPYLRSTRSTPPGVPRPPF